MVVAELLIGVSDSFSVTLALAPHGSHLYSHLYIYIAVSVSQRVLDGG